jgi:hypothetical protein
LAAPDLERAGGAAALTAAADDARSRRERRRHAELVLGDPGFRRALLAHLRPALREQGLECADCAD